VNRRSLWWLLVSVAAALACGVSWWAAQTRVDVAHQQLVTLALLAAAVAGIAVVGAVAPLLARRRVSRLS